MCEICEGSTIDEYLEHVREVVRSHGWALQSVGGSGAVGWVYTIGLTSSYGHPELLTIDTDVGRAARLLNELGRMVRDGGRLRPGIMTTADDGTVELLAVHPVHARSDLVATWHSLHAPEAPELDLLQVVVPEVVAHGPRGLRERLDRAFARTP
jgi:hypothetical protein